MNQIKTYIDRSNIEGIGLFAAEFIPKGTLIWKLDGLDQVFSKEEIEKINLKGIKDHYFKRYMFEMNEHYIFCSDDARFTNHSNNSNTISSQMFQYAKNNIQIGEEITCDYSEINDYFEESEFEELISYKNDNSQQ